MSSVATDLPLLGIQPYEIAPPRFAYPYANNADLTTRVVTRTYKQLLSYYSPGRVGIDIDPMDPSAYQAAPDSDLTPASFGASVVFTRTYARIPAIQTVYSARLIDRPVMHDIKSGTGYAVSFDNGITSHRFSSRISVSGSPGAIALAATTVDNAAEAITDFASATFTATDTGAASVSPNFTSSASSIESSLRAGLAAVTGLTVTKGVGTITITWTGGMRAISTSATGVAIDGSVGSGSVTYRKNRDAVTAAETINPTAPTATRAITTGSAHSGAAGEWMAAWNGDKLVGMIKPTAASGSSITIAADESPWNVGGLVVTHIAFAGQAAARYVNGPVSVTVKEITTFYLPGVSTGITTPADITLASPKIDPVSWLGEIIAATAYVQIEGSKLERWLDGPIYAQTNISAQMSDALDTVAVGA